MLAFTHNKKHASKQYSFHIHIEIHRDYAKHNIRTNSTITFQW